MTDAREEIPSSSAMRSRAQSPDTASLPHRRSKHKKRDSGLDLPGLDLIRDQDELDSNSHHHDQSQAESLFTHVILTPLMMISFLLSLCYVNRQQRAWRVSQHPQPGTSIWAKLSLRSWVNPEPYQDPTDSTWNCKDTSASGATVPQPAWHTRNRHRKMASMQINDAFNMRGRVVVMIAVWGSIALACTYWLIMKISSVFH